MIILVVVWAAVIVLGFKPATFRATKNESWMWEKEVAMSSSIGNLFMKAIINSPLHPLLGEHFAVVTVVGRKTGKQYSTPINVTKDGTTFTATSLRNRTWWRNLRGGLSATLRTSGKQFSVSGEVIEHQERVEEEMARFFKRNPQDARFLGVRLASDGIPSSDNIQRAAGERVIIRFHMH